MAFIGRSPDSTNLTVLLDAISPQNSTATYNLLKGGVAYTPISAHSLTVSLNGVTQAPISAYTVNASQITFASNLTTNDVIDYIIAVTGPVKYIKGSNIGSSEITTAMLASGAVTVAKMAANSVDSDQYVDGSIDLAHMSANSVDSDQYVDGSIDLAHMSANSVDSDQYVDGSIDTAHIANSQITNALMADDAIGVAELSATGTASASTFLCGNNTWAEAGSYNRWTVKTAGYTAVAKDQSIINATSAVTVTLPSSATAGDCITLKNIGTHAITIGRNGLKIESADQDGSLGVSQAMQIVYVSATVGWKEI